jgi:hypothetical protein
MFILKEMDHSIGAVTPLVVAEIPSDTLLELTDSSPCPPSALMGQIGEVEEGRISGSS